MAAQQEKLQQSLPAIPKDWTSLRAQVKDSTTDALASVAHAIEVLSAQVSPSALAELKAPQKLGNLFHSVRDAARHSAVLQASSAKLQDIATRLSDYATKGEQVPKVILASFTVALQDIRDTVASLYTPWKESSVGDPQEAALPSPSDNFVHYFDVLHDYISPRKAQ